MERIPLGKAPNEAENVPRLRQVLVKMLGTWDSSVFDVPTVTRIVETELKTAQTNEDLKEALLVLYDYSHRHDKTLRMLLRDRSTRVFDYISNHELFEAVREKESIQTLYGIDENSTSRLLVREADSTLPSAAVVSILEVSIVCLRMHARGRA